MAGKTVEEQVLEALVDVKDDLEDEGRKRRRGLLLQAVGLAVAGLITTSGTAWIVHESSCRTITKANKDTLFVLEALVASGAKRDVALPPALREEARVRREESLQIGRDILSQDACR